MTEAQKLYDRAAELVRKAAGASCPEERRRLLREAKEVGLRAAQVAGPPVVFLEGGDAETVEPAQADRIVIDRAPSHRSDLG